MVTPAVGAWCPIRKTECKGKNACEFGRLCETLFASGRFLVCHPYAEVSLSRKGSVVQTERTVCERIRLDEADTEEKRAA
jgi:hypothetical protein